MWNKIVSILSTAWLLALIVIAAGIGFVVMHITPLGVITVLLGLIYLCYTVYWSLPELNKNNFVTLVSLLFGLIMIFAILFVIMDINK